ncbi:MAG: URC4/urg3 family protein [Beijerinckiaceae bacterium]|nr:URC4/urg3 family protein [Beijerinckiaceae bacterium]
MSAVERADLGNPDAAARWLLTTEAIRARSGAILDLGLRNELAHFRIQMERLSDAAAYVAGVMRENYPDLVIPYHARWRHFTVGGHDRWGALARELAGVDRDEIARIRFDLCVTSVLLDAGAGDQWRFFERDTGLRVGRSEGLALASLSAFRAGVFSSDPGHPLRADAQGLAAVSEAALADAFQAGPDNPLIGVAGRTTLMTSLGQALAARSDLFGGEARIGRLYDHLAGQAANGSLPASAILAAVLDGLGPIWPSRLSLAGHSLGDVWRHAGIVTPDLTSGLVPFHKLSQWLTYSLIEIFEDAGLSVSGLDALTGLPEYRNGGLFLDLGVIALRDSALAEQAHAPGDEIIVEWRALTVALLDALADPVRAALGKSKTELPLARILEGGTWSAGRKIAREKRADGGPPIRIASDGTVF